MQSDIERKEEDAGRTLSKSMSGMGTNLQKVGKTLGESHTDGDRFIRMIEVTSNAYGEALRRLAEGEPGDH